LAASRRKTPPISSQRHGRCACTSHEVPRYQDRYFLLSIVHSFLVIDHFSPSSITCTLQTNPFQPALLFSFSIQDQLQGHYPKEPKTSCRKWANTIQTSPRGNGPITTRTWDASDRGGLDASLLPIARRRTRLDRRGALLLARKYSQSEKHDANAFCSQNAQTLEIEDGDQLSVRRDQEIPK